MNPMMSVPSVFILLWNSMQATPSPRSTSDAPEFFLTTPLDFFATVTDQTPAGTSNGCSLARLRDPNTCGPKWTWDHRRTRTSVPTASSFSTLAATRLTFFLHASNGGLDAGGVPQFEGAEFPVEPEPHRAIDLDN